MSQRMQAFCAINLPCSGKDKKIFCTYYTFSYIETTNSLMQQRDTDLQLKLGSTKGKEEKYKMSTLTRNSKKNCNILYLPTFKPNVAADERRYFHLKFPSLRQSGKAFSLSSIKLRLMGQEQPVWPIEVKRRRED
jgi:hypothetical protein